LIQILLQSLFRLGRQLRLVPWLLVLVPAALLFTANTDLGRRLLSWGILELTSGRVVLQGLSGALPWAPRLQRLELRDQEGAWLVVEEAALDLRLRSLARAEIDVASSTARTLTLHRLPAASGDGVSWAPPPLRIRLGRVAIEEVHLVPAFPDAPWLSVEGEATLGGSRPLEARLEVRAPGRPDRYRLDLQTAPEGHRLALSLAESPEGLLPALAGSLGWPLPARLADWRLDLQAAGPTAALALRASLEAGPLQAAAEGLIDLGSRSAAGLHLEAQVPSMNLSIPKERPIGWDALALTADLSGPWDAPRGAARVDAVGITSGALGLERLRVTARGDRQALAFEGELQGPMAPVDLPESARRVPLGILGAIALAEPARAFALVLDHPLLALTAEGLLGPPSATPDEVALAWTLDLPELGALSPGWTGSLQARGEIAGPWRTPALEADLDVRGGHARLGDGRLQGRVRALLAERRGTLDLGGDWAGQPLVLRLGAARSVSGDIRLAPIEGRWASLIAAGDLVLAPGAPLPRGELRLQLERLGDLAPWLGASGPREVAGLGGRLRARLELDGEAARIEARGEELALPGALRIQGLVLDGQASDPLGAGDTRGRLLLTGLSAGGTAGDLTLSVDGPLRDLALDAEAKLSTAAGPSRLALDSRLDAPARRLTLRRLEGRAADQALSLLEPAAIDLAQGVSVDRLRLGLGPGSLEIRGRLLPRLDLDFRVARLPLEPIAMVASDLPLAGTLDGEARLTGTPGSLTGPVHLKAQGVRLTRGAGRGLAPADVELSAQLGPTVTRIDASARAGADNRLGLRGTLGPGALDLRADGRVDLALLDPLLTALGRQAAGQATLDARIAGDPRAPRLDGTLRMSNGAIWDRAIGLALTEVNGRILLAGDTLRLDGVSARAGPGSLSLAGSIGVLAPAVPVDLRLVARDASPLQRDLLNVQGDGDLRLSGQALGRLDLAGAVQLSRVDIRLPERLPASVVTLEVREVGQRRAGSPDAPQRVPWRPDLGLDLLLSAPRGVSVQGRGVDAELGGEVRLRGTLEAPQVTGGFDLRRGEYDLVGQTLRFSRGRLGFEGAAGLDPTLDLEARMTVAGTTAILAVQGTTRAPRIDLRGEPEMPQDEVLSRLLFGVAGGRLSPWQATRVGLAAASLAGIEIADGDVLERIRRGLGLGRLGANATGGGILQGGRQLSERVYLGTRQGERAGERQGVLRIEATPSIRLEADVGPVGGTRAGAAFEIEY